MENEWKFVVKAIKRKIIKPIKNGNDSNIMKIKNNKHIVHSETSSLLMQAYKTLNNAEVNINSYRIVDACILMRSAFEYITMGMVIQFDEDTFNEFKILGLEDRDKTKILRIQYLFRKHMNEISNDFYKELSRANKKELLKEIYDKLCNYTHSSLIVCTITNIDNIYEKEILRLSLLQSLYFLESLLFFSLKYFTGDTAHFIEWEDIWFAELFTHIKIGHIARVNNIDFKKYDDFFYYDDNEDYLNKNTIKNSKIKEQYNEFGNYIHDNSEVFNQMLKRFLS